MVVSNYDFRHRLGGRLTPQSFFWFGVSAGRYFLEWYASAMMSKEQIRVVIGHDSRPTSKRASLYFLSGLRAAGVGAAIHMGPINSPGIYLASIKLRAAGIIITASHNPEQYNGFKLCLPNAHPISKAALQLIVRYAMRLIYSGIGRKAILGQCFSFKSALPLGVFGLQAGHRASFAHPSAPMAHIQNAYTHFLEKYAKVVGVMSGSNASNCLQKAGFVMLSHPYAGVRVIARALGLSYISAARVNCQEYEVTSSRAKKPIEAAMLGHNLNMAITFDGDQDRLIIYIRPPGEEMQKLDSEIIAYTIIKAIAFSGKEALAGIKGNCKKVIVLDQYASLQCIEAIKGAGFAVVVSRTGHTWFKSAMRESGAVMGFESSGHFYFRVSNISGEPASSYDDGIHSAIRFLGACTALEYQEVGDISAQAKAIAEVSRLYVNIPCSSQQKAKSAIRSVERYALQLNASHINKMDGVSFFIRGVQIITRPSGTESLIRLTAISKCKSSAQAQIETIKEVISQAFNGQGTPPIKAG